MSAAEQLEGPYEVLCSSDDREEWLRRRMNGIGASEASAVLGVGFISAAELWAIKTGRKESDDLSEIERVQWGHIHEPVIIEQYSKPWKANRPARRAALMLRSTEHPWAFATLDGWATHPEHGEIPLEAKTVHAFDEKEWEEGVPERYRWQVDHQMLVTGAPCASVACLLGGNRLVWADVPRDEERIRLLVDACEEFMQHVRDDVMPPADGTDSARRAILATWPEQVVGKHVELDASLVSDVEELHQIKDELKRLGKRKGAIENRIRQEMGDAEVGVLPSGHEFTLKTQHRKAFSVAASSTRVLRARAPKGGR